MAQSVYLDYAATTPIDPRVCSKMMECLAHFGNASSSHWAGKVAKQLIDTARMQVAELIGAEDSEIIWTSGATEANNLALKGAASLYKNKGRHIITIKTEHPSVLETCQALEKQGFSVTYLTPEPNGMIDLEKLRLALRPETMLVSIMHVNNELGVIQPIESIAEITAKQGILFHVDAAQSAGKIPLTLRNIPIDLLSLSAHKVYGPKGIGALYVRRKPRVRVAPLFHGGGHEQGMRSGTLPTHQIVGMGEAFSIANNEMPQESQSIRLLREQFLQKLSEITVVVNGNSEKSYPGILNIRFPGIKAKELLESCPELALSVGSACLTKGIEPSYVLRALGQTVEQAHGGLRVSFGRFTTLTDIEETTKKIVRFFHGSFSSSITV